MPVDWLSAASGGEITTVAPGLKFDPTSVICTWLAPRTSSPGVALVNTGAAPGLATVSVTVFDCNGAGPLLITTTANCAGAATRLAGTVT